MIYKLKSFSCKVFAIFFHLWSGGGPNWHKDFELLCSEQEAKWTLVGSKFKNSYVDAVRSKPSGKNPSFYACNIPRTMSQISWGKARVLRAKLLILLHPGLLLQAHLLRH
jgi:hypothetical protein